MNRPECEKQISVNHCLLHTACAAATETHRLSLFVSNFIFLLYNFFCLFVFLHSSELIYVIHISVKVMQMFYPKFNRKKQKRQTKQQLPLSWEMLCRIFFLIPKPEAQTLLLKPKTPALKKKKQNKTITHRDLNLGFHEQDCVYISKAAITCQTLQGETFLINKIISPTNNIITYESNATVSLAVPLYIHTNIYIF